MTKKDITMLIRILGRSMNAGLSWLGLRLLRKHTFDGYVQREAAAAIEIHQLKGEREALEQRYHASEGVRLSLEARLQATQERLRETARLAALKRKAAGGTSESAVAVVLVTTTTQISQAELLLTELRVARIRPIVVSYVSAHYGVLVEMCRSQGVGVVNHELKPLHLVEDLPTDISFQATYRTPGKVSYANRHAEWSRLVEDKWVVPARLGDELQFQNGLREACSGFLHQAGADILLLFEDNAESETGIWVVAARGLGVPSAIVPFTIADEKEPAEAHVNDPMFAADANAYNRLVAQLYPQWVLEYKGKRLLRRPGISAVAAEWLGVAPPLPWILNSTLGNAIAVESRAMLDHYRRLGVPEDKLVLTGSLSDDILFAAREAGRSGVKCMMRNGDERVLLCAFPPNQLGVGRPKCEFRDYADLMEFWLTELETLRGWKIVIRPHPFMPAGDVELLRRSGFFVSDAPTAKLIPDCDLYVASVSATIRWALAMGKPVLNYDVFAYGYVDYNSAGAVFQAGTKAEFSSALQAYANDERFLRDQAEVAVKEAGYWGEIDGKSSQRLRRLFEHLMNGADAGAPVSSGTPYELAE
ncbi:hypothetical protein [Pseudorhodoplanes sp.]|uniref:hypothetical protein n=1 Tax=Pseudorhodoplanes sp. TaxID=1934341 RepID=UPI003D1319C6